MLSLTVLSLKTGPKQSALVDPGRGKHAMQQLGHCAPEVPTRLSLPLRED